MFQQEMFSNGSFKGAKFIAHGCYGSVYAHPDSPDDWVVKYAGYDGTLNYLEWCKFMQDSGRGMRGMPEIDVLVHTDNSRYMVTMRRYTEASHLFSTGRSVLSQCQDNNEYSYIVDLIDAFDEYCSYNLDGCWYSIAGDLHRGNIMWCGRTNSLIVTDPSAAKYFETTAGFFELH